ncbi:MAG: ATP-dependent DNA helicase [Polyangiales bacterium]
MRLAAARLACYRQRSVTSKLADRVAAALSSGGPISRGLSAAGARFEPREGQIEMARAVASAIDDERTLLCEAGTGTGKTLGYLVPALLSGRRVVVSTATKALQEQIFTKDVPLLAAHLGVSFEAAMMKGLGNYLCRRRLGEALLAAGDGALRDARAQASSLGRIALWARESEVGDRAELSWLRDEDLAWRDVQSGSDTRVGAGCAHYDVCFVTKMRAAAQRARLVVVNHHLYLADLALRKGGARQGVIPEHDVVIFDEAHQLEEIGTEFFGVRISTAKIDALTRDAKKTLASLGAIAAKGRADGDEGSRALTNVESASLGFFSELAREKTGKIGFGDAPDSRSPLSDDAWSATARERLGRLDAALEALVGVCKTAQAKGDDRETISALERRITGIRNDLARVAAPRRDDVAWIEVRLRSCSIGVSPIDLAPVFRDELFTSRGQGSPTSFVLTSATMAAAGATDRDPFRHAKRRLGLVPVAREPIDDDDFVDHDPSESKAPNAPIELLVASPFDFKTHAGVYVPLDLPEPSAPDFVAHAGKRSIELVRASGGGAFVLCASTRNMRALHATIGDARLPYKLFCQGEAPKTELLERFREDGHAVLVATMGFWEGVDVPGHALRLVIIDKLPFAVPTDPVVAARHRRVEERGGSPFAEITVPDAAIALKQGFGRLIRTSEDAGVVAILDKRIRTKGYGRALRAALPSASALHSLDDVQTFFRVIVGVESDA